MILSDIMLITIGSTVLRSKLVNNSSTDALKELLYQSPLTIQMNDYGNFEKVGPIGTTLPRNDVLITTEPGDIILYLGSNLCLYYNTNTYTFTRIGKIQDVNQDDLKKILGEGSVTVTFSLEKNNDQTSDYQVDQSYSNIQDQSSIDEQSGQISEQFSDHFSQEIFTDSDYLSQPPTNTIIPPPTRPPIETEEIDLNDFDVNENNVTIDMNKDSFKNNVLYNVHIPEQIKNVMFDSNSNKTISLILSEKMKEISIFSNEDSNNQIDIFPKSDEIIITLDKGTITLENTENKALNINRIYPQSNKFILIPKVSIKIQEIEFSGNQAMNIQTTTNNNNNNINVEVEKIKIQPHSTGTINNANINNIVLGPFSKIKLVENVDISNSVIELPFNNNMHNSQALISGELNSIPKTIFFNTRDFGYLDIGDRLLIAESESTNFQCEEWVKTFQKGPFNSKFNDAECKDEKINNKNMNVLYAFVNDNKQNVDNKGLSGGEIAGIVIGVVVFVAVVVGVLVYFFVIKKKKDATQSSEPLFESIIL